MGSVTTGRGKVHGGHSVYSREAAIGICTFILFSCVLISGCTTLRISLPVQSSTFKVSPRPAQKDEVIGFVLSKPWSENIQVGKTVYSWGPETKVFALDDPALWIQNSLAAALQEAGYRLEMTTGQRRPHTGYIIMVDATDVWAEMYVRPTDFLETSRVSARVKVYDSGTQILNRIYTGYHSGTLTGTLGIIHYRQKEYQKSFDAALHFFLQQVVSNLSVVVSIDPTPRKKATDKLAPLRSGLCPVPFTLSEFR